MIGQKTTSSFIKEAKIVHGEKFNYSKVKYEKWNIKIEIICSQHGSFFQTPNSHLKGAGCAKCAGNIKRTTKEFIEESNNVHKNKYDYSKSHYKKNNDKLIIICHEHGAFKQMPTAHLNGSGCPKCGDISGSKKRKMTLSCFIKKANELHDFIYDYSDTAYEKNNNTKVKIKCRTHGFFWQLPSNHLSGKGCDKCRLLTSRPEKEWLDVLNVPSEYRQVKIKFENRYAVVDGFDPVSNTVYEFYGDFWHGNPKVFKPEEINPITNCLFSELFKKTKDREKLLIKNGFKIISIWESDFKENS